MNIYVYTYIHTYCGDNFCLIWLTKLVVLYHHWSSLIWHEDEDFPMWDSPKPKMTTSATLGLGKNCLHTYIYVCMYVIVVITKITPLRYVGVTSFFFVDKLGVTSLYYTSKSL